MQMVKANLSWGGRFSRLLCSAPIPASSQLSSTIETRTPKLHFSDTQTFQVWDDLGPIN